ncbi:MAG: SRPBCC family protein [Chloroflexi bacterium]|nr:SRPBCC family protein [Chloroflexota bacterium]
MRYTEEIIINLPRERVIELFDSFENLKQWQEGLVEIEHLSGEPGTPGAQTRLLYDMGKRKLEMIETITTRNMPDEFSGAYDAKGVYNIVRNTFHPQGETTRWNMDCEFQFRGFMRIMAFFMRQRTFRKQTRKGMESFKIFAEGAGS